jgi:hypothetical protein
MPKQKMMHTRYRIEYAADKRRPTFPSAKEAIAFLRAQGYTVGARNALTGHRSAYESHGDARRSARGGPSLAKATIVPWNDPIWRGERDRMNQAHLAPLVRRMWSEATDG